MLLPFYQTCLRSRLRESTFLTLQLLVLMLQIYRDVRIERLAALFPQPIKFESRRRNLQRFLVLPELTARYLWFPIIKGFLRQQYQPKNRSQRRRLKRHGKKILIIIDRTQWKQRNLFMASLVWDRRALPLYWHLLNKVGCSNLTEQKALIAPLVRLLKGYKVMVLADREFHSVKLAKFLQNKGFSFVLRQKKSTNIKVQEEAYKRLSDIGLVSGTSLFITGVAFTKQKGFGQFNLAANWKQTYRGKVTKQGWYILTDLPDLTTALNSYRARFGIEAMFRDFKRGGYQLEATHTAAKRLVALVLLITIAYSCSVLRGQQLKRMGIQKYINRLQELQRSQRRHSNFWVGLYGQLWIGTMEVWGDLATALTQLKPNKRLYFQQGLRAMTLIQSTF